MASRAVGDPGLKYDSLNTQADASHGAAFELLGEASSVLEIGAATGYVTQALTQLGIDVVGVEIDARAVEVARSRGIQLRHGTVSTAVRAEELFDAVLLLDVIEHVADPDTFLVECLSHLRDRGSLVISVPNIAHWSIRLALLRGRFDYTSTGILDDTHLRFFTAKSLDALLGRHGLTVVERRQTVGGPWGAVDPQRVNVTWQTRKLQRRLARTWPRLFGFQFVWKATRA